jgi:hypothetical protein
MRDAAPAVAAHQRLHRPPTCPSCKTLIVDPDVGCPTCQQLAENAKLAKARLDRRAEFYDDASSLLTVRLKADGERWAVFVEHQPHKRAARVGMKSDFLDRSVAVARFRDLVRDVRQMGGWKAVCVPWDLRIVDPRLIDQIDV